MTTDDERREVAARLREQGIRFYAPSAWNALGEALGIDGPRNSDTVCARLTDLIDPPAKPYDSPDSTNKETLGERDPVVDREALLALADEMDAEKNFVLVGGYARRIRELCGEVAS